MKREPRPDYMPHSVLGRLVIQVVSFEWYTTRAVLMTAGTLVCVAIGEWVAAAAFGAVTLAFWAWLVRRAIRDDGR